MTVSVDRNTVVKREVTSSVVVSVSVREEEIVPTGLTGTSHSAGIVNSVQSIESVQKKCFRTHIRNCIQGGLAGLRKS